MENTSRIPKIIHYCGFGSGQMSEQENMCIESWKKYCPDYTFIEWNDSNYNIHKCTYMEQAASVGKWSFVTDYVRLDVLYEYGGIYLDTDVELLKEFDSLLMHKAFIGFEQDDRVNDGQGMGAEPHLHMIREMRDMYEKISFFHEDGSLNLRECTQYRTQYLQKRGLILNGERQTVGDIEVYPTEYFCPKSFLTGKLTVTDKTYSIHHFRGAWHTDKEKKIIRFMQIVRRVLGEKVGSTVLKGFFEMKDFILKRK